jgi:hypothetical protein
MRNRTYKLNTGHRGRITGVQDQIKAAVYAKGCEVCGKSFVRKMYESGRFETWPRFFARRSCSKKCKAKLIEGEKNPKWRGGLPVCLRCFKKTRWYKGKHNPQRFCKKCFIELQKTTPHKYLKNRLDDVAMIGRRMLKVKSNPTHQ